MNVTIVVGGRWHAFDLARELNKYGCLHRIITNYPSWFVRKWGIPQEKIVSLPLTFYIIKIIYKLGGQNLMMRCQWWVHSIFANAANKYLDGSEIIHCWSQWAEPSLLWAEKNNIPTVLERSSAHIQEQCIIMREEFRRHGKLWVETHKKIVDMELREYELCSAVAVPSLFVERSFLKHGYPTNKIFRNTLGVSLDQFGGPLEEIRPPTVLGLNAIYVGSLSLRKGIPDLLEACHGLDGTGLKLTLVGGRDKDLDNLLDNKPKCVIEIGHKPQSELINYYHQSHCFVLASVEEGMAMVQMQALACGLPIICTKNTGGEDLLIMDGDTGEECENGIKQYRAGFLIPIHSPESIEYCLRRLATEVDLWREMKKQALIIANNKLSWEGYAKRAIKHYRTLVK